MRLAIVSQQGRKASGAEHALLGFLDRLPPDVEVQWFFFEDGEFAQTIRATYASVTIVKMSARVATAERGGLPVSAVVGSISLATRLARALARARPDLVVTNSMKAHIIGSLAAKLAGRRCINYIHDIVEGRARDLLRLVSRVCAVERLTCSGLVKQHVNLPRTTVVYAAIDITRFAQLPDRQESRRLLGLPRGTVPVVGLVGRIARWKGQDRFIRIAAAVLEAHDAHFCIVGSPIFGCDATYVDELAAEVERRGLTGRVTFVPWQESMERVYAALDIACNCSTREPFGRTSLEALASGVPTVCFDDAGICEIFDQERGASRVTAGDERAFAGAIGTYLSNPETRSRAGIQARAIARTMDVSRAYAVFVEAMERATQSRIGSARDRRHDAATANGRTGDDERQDDECLVS